MSKSRCVLAATDFSGTSRASLAIARDLAAAIGARLHIIHVILDPAQLPWTIDTGLTPVNLERAWRKQAEAALERARSESGLTPEFPAATARHRAGLRALLPDLSDEGVNDGEDAVLSGPVDRGQGHPAECAGSPVEVGELAVGVELRVHEVLVVNLRLHRL
jgi:nucleotide-binding universal stress UspA family protein